MPPSRPMIKRPLGRPGVDPSRMGPTQGRPTSQQKPALQIKPQPASAEQREDEWADDDDAESILSASELDRKMSEALLSGAKKDGEPLVKVISLSVEEGQLTHMPIANLPFAVKSFSALLSGTKLSDIRGRLTNIIKKNSTYAFCSDEAALSPSEDITLKAYAQMTNQDDEKFYIGVFRVYIIPTSEPAQRQRAVLLKPPFQLKFIQLGATANDALNTGSLHSSSFQGKDASKLPLGELRRLIGKMSTSSEMHTFCSKDGTVAGDELTLSQYLALDDEGIQESQGTPSILVLYRRTDSKNAASTSKFHGASPEVLAAMQELRPDLTITDRTAEELHVDKTGFKVQEELNASQFAAQGANPSKLTSQMDEADWNAVLRNCNLLYGWKINKKTNRVERAATPAFRLKVKKPMPLNIPPQIESSVVASPVDKANQSQAVLPKATGNDMEKSSSSVTDDETPATSPLERTPASTEAETFENDQPAALALAAEDIASVIPTKLGAVPSFIVNDQSRINITVASSEFQESMAKNHFDSTSVEASVSGGYGGYSGGVTGGVASENSNKSVNTNKTFSKRMIASYMFPRVDVLLRPEDMEPTDELRLALQLVQNTKDINNLRKLYATFGHLFCHTATLGGCLQTAKIVSGSQDTSESEEKESFKASVGVAFSTPIGVGGSVKASHETSDSSSNYKSQTNTRESMSFEATGGNSILAADPPAWSGSVADFNNWRVINQSELTPLVEAIAAMSGYEPVRQWFLLATPKLSQYYVIPDSRALHVRFKFAGQNESFAKLTGQGQRDQAYLGLDPTQPPKPVRMGLRQLQPESHIRESMSSTLRGIFPSVDLTRVSTQVDLKTSDAMFFPPSTQGPVLMFPDSKEVGTIQDKRLGETLWRLEVPTGYSLGPDCKVCIKSCAPVRASPDKPAAPADLALTVYRNAQGVFMPAISSSDEPCYWRLRRANDTAIRSGSTQNGPQEAFRHGEPFRLTWSISDQSSGYRDYTEDLYGRRSFAKPMADTWPGGMDTLCLKIPYPRFESSGVAGTPVSLVMHPALTSDPIVQPIKVRRTEEEGRDGPDTEINYVLYDLTFRVDYVGDEGVGDSRDFMNVVTDAHGEERTEHTWETPAGSRSGGFGSPEATIAGAVLGAAVAPAMGVVSLISSIFSL